MKKIQVFVQFVAMSCIVIIVLIARTDVVDLAGNMAKKVVRRILVSDGASPPNTTKKVLVYTAFFGSRPWDMPGMDSPPTLFTQYDKRPCPFRCYITYNKSELPDSDGVLFHTRDLPVTKELYALSLKRPQRQRWVIFGMENPKNVPNHVQNLNGLFNWTMMYTRNADIYTTYGLYRNITPDEIPKNYINYAKGKSKLVAIAFSNCGKPRDEIVSKLTQLIPVTIFGRCNRHFPMRSKGVEECPKGTPQCARTLRKFKFYLSFENALCKDYITEKYWETPFWYDMVPIVYGSNYDAMNSIPGSYINVFDFPSIEALAKYIQFLDKNDTAYNEYFRWKTKYQRIDPYFGCQLCADLHNKELPAKVHTDLRDFWSEENSCSHEENELVSDLVDGTREEGGGGGGRKL